MKLELTRDEAQLLLRATLYGLKGPDPVVQDAITAKRLTDKMLAMYKQMFAEA